MKLAEAAAVVDVARSLEASPDYTIARLARALVVLAKHVSKCSTCGNVATAIGFLQTEEEADADDPLTIQPIARRRALRCEEHAAGLHEVEPLG